MPAQYELNSKNKVITSTLSRFSCTHLAILIVANMGRALITNWVHSYCTNGVVSETIVSFTTLYRVSNKFQTVLLASYNSGTSRSKNSQEIRPKPEARM